MSGLDGEGVVNRTFVGIEGEPAGVLGLAAGKPLTAQDLAPIPRDANLAFAGRLDLARLMDTVLTITEKIEPQARAGSRAEPERHEGAVGGRSA